MRWSVLMLALACGGSNAEEQESSNETTAGSQVVTDEAWEQSAWEPEPEPEPVVETWTFEEWQERLRDLAESHNCGALATVPSLETGVGAYLDEESPDALLEAHEALSRALREWGVECHASAGDEVVESTVGELCGQLERITSERLDEL